MLSKDNAPLNQTHKHNLSNGTIQHLTQEFIELQRENSNLINNNNRGLVNRLFSTKKEKLQNQTQIEKMRAYHEHEMKIGSAICEAKEKELQMQIAAALSQKRIVLDAQTKERIAGVYQEFSVTMNDCLNEAVRLYLKSLKDAEIVSNKLAKQKLINYAEQKFNQDCDLIQDLVNNFLKNIYAHL